MYLKIKSELLGAHVHERLFVGPDKEHLALAGTLVFDIGEWQLFGAALLLGAQQTQGNLIVECEGDKEVARASIGGGELQLERPPKVDG